MGESSGLPSGTTSSLLKQSSRMSGTLGRQESHMTSLSFADQDSWIGTSDENYNGLWHSDGSWGVITHASGEIDDQDDESDGGEFKLAEDEFFSERRSIKQFGFIQRLTDTAYRICHELDIVEPTHHVGDQWAEEIDENNVDKDPLDLGTQGHISDLKEAFSKEEILDMHNIFRKIEFRSLAAERVSHDNISQNDFEHYFHYNSHEVVPKLLKKNYDAPTMLSYFKWLVLETGGGLTLKQLQKVWTEKVAETSDLVDMREYFTSLPNPKTGESIGMDFVKLLRT